MDIRRANRLLEAVSRQLRESPDWKVGDKVRLRMPGTPWHGLYGTITGAEVRKASGTTRFTVTSDQGREIYASDGQLLPGRGTHEAADLTPERERELVAKSDDVRRGGKNPFIAQGKNGIYVGFQTVSSTGAGRLTWTNQGLKDITRTSSRVEVVHFGSKAEAEHAVKAEILPFIHKWRKDQGHLIIGW